MISVIWLCCKNYDEGAPQLITHVETTQAPITDEHSLPAIHASLAERKLLPGHHLVDAGYVTIDNLVQSRIDSGVDLLGPTLKTHWYQAETGYDLTHFSIDWEYAESPKKRKKEEHLFCNEGNRCRCCLF
ncbi:hypothetical protein ccbrp13_01730 [Ktedonobacteria bacterium brp13]|nr:hypothetical protein ccbrp13_01730 [Ktedonobacteria bacterium brp13]